MFDVMPSDALVVCSLALNFVLLLVMAWVVWRLLRADCVIVAQGEANDELNLENARLLRLEAERG